MRVALSKFYKTKKVTTESEAVQKLLTESLLPFMSSFNAEKWRTEKLYNLE